MKIIGYTRISTEKQDLDKQRHLLHEYAHQKKVVIDQILEIEVSSGKSQKERRIDELKRVLNDGDLLLVSELSRLGRNMMETLNIINSLTEKGIQIVFIRQPELSTTSSHQKLLLALYSYFAESEREYISIRTKQGLAAAKAQGKMLGRPKGSKNKKPRALDTYKEQIMELLELKVSLASISKIINKQLEKPITYASFKYHIEHDSGLSTAWKSR